MKRKYILFFMQFLTSVCMVSVGFASWTIVSGASLEATGNVVAENVTSNEKYIKLTSSDVFGYYNTGFVVFDSSANIRTISNIGTLTYKYEINLNQCKNDMCTNEVLSTPIIFNFALNYGDYEGDCPLFDYATATISYNYVDDLDLSSDVTDVNSINFYIDNLSSFNVTDENKNLYISVMYTFDCSKIDFSTMIYPHLSSKDFCFLVKTNVSC